ncbi:26258_t:CDS:1 [Racocetra persica]|uniref:26258_t:CDS:1 n=1 Tax=Racocetra persica TaxID=160502 RepID=A0ACA9SVE9_9GLOM|nr:26258_t:CDS:1 [Racocetra persica]
MAPKSTSTQRLKVTWLQRRLQTTALESHNNCNSFNNSTRITQRLQR